MGEKLPKALVEIDKDKTILDHQLENLKKIINSKDIVVVVGFKKDLIIKKHPNLSFLFNQDYIETNTSKSLLIALENIDHDDDILWLNGDIVFESEILNFIAEYSNENLICVNNSPVSEEEVKYLLNRDGYVKEISKNVENAIGEAVGINFIKKEFINQFISCLKDCKKMDYFENGIECAIKKGVNFLPIDIKDYFCTEIDFQEDLKKARKFMQRKT